MKIHYLIYSIEEEYGLHGSDQVDQTSHYSTVLPTVSRLLIYIKALLKLKAHQKTIKSALGIAETQR
jgi:hypothetical protein